MSGYKHATVTISQEEYRRLQAADVKKRFKEFTRISASQDSGQNEVVLNLIKEMEARELELQNALSSLQNTTNAYDEQTVQNLINQNTAYYENLASILRESNSDLQGTVSNLNEEFSQILQQEREQVMQSIQTLFSEQESYLDREYQKEEAAQQWLNRCVVLADFVGTQFDHRRFTPCRLDRILRNLSYAESNLSNGYTEISIQNSQQSYLELTDLNFELEQLLLQWNSAFETTYSAVNEFIYQIEANGMIQALDLNGRELPDLIDLDYWTNGRYHQLLEHCKNLTAYLSEDRSLLSLEDIDRIYNQVLPAIRESFESIVFDARLNALNSQLRMNIAEKALEALEQHGFVLDRAGYSDNDMRAQFNAQLECVDGSQVTIQVLPDGKSGQELSNELVVITTHPFLKTEHEARLRWEELSRTLGQYQLTVCRPEIVSPGQVLSAEENESTHRQEQSQTYIER
jgi:hypothetical protein